MRPLTLVPVVLLGALTATGCGSSTAESGPPTPSASASATPATATATAATVPTGVATPAPTVAPAGCTLQASLGAPNSFAGHAVVTVVLHNAGTSVCAMNGFPVVTLTGPSGTVSTVTEQQGGGQAARATPAPVSIAAGASAQFLVEFADVGSGTAPCPTVTVLGYQLPGGAGSGHVNLQYPLQPCPPQFSVGAVTPAT